MPDVPGELGIIEFKKMLSTTQESPTTKGKTTRSERMQPTDSFTTNPAEQIITKGKLYNKEFVCLMKVKFF